MKKLLTAIGCLMVLTSCGSQQALYSWYDSEDAAYTYTKRGTEETLTKAMAQYEMVTRSRTDCARQCHQAPMPSMATCSTRRVRNRKV